MILAMTKKEFELYQSRGLVSRDKLDQQQNENVLGNYGGILVYRLPEKMESKLKERKKQNENV